MPRPPFTAEVKRIFTPNKECMVRALEIVRDWNPSKSKADSVNQVENRIRKTKERVKEAG